MFYYASRWIANKDLLRFPPDKTNMDLTKGSINGLRDSTEWQQNLYNRSIVQGNWH